MRLPLIALLAWGCLLPVMAESIEEWADAAPKAKVAFTAWDGDLPQASDNEAVAHRLAQKFYGYLDLSGLPPDAFPIQLRIYYDPIKSDDVSPGLPGTLSQPSVTSPLGSELVTEEVIVASLSEGRAVPVWIEPAPMQERLRFDNAQESVRAEILDRSGRLSARLIIGASRLSTQRPQALLINTPSARASFVRGGYVNISEATKLVPDSFALNGVDAVWIDSQTASDPALTAAFWQEVILGGTKVVGASADIAALSRRLGLTSGQSSVIVGGLIAADSPESFASSQGSLQPAYDLQVLVDGPNPFSFAASLGGMMHHELLVFSLGYLVVFLVLQALVVFGGFYFFRGPTRVWIWLVIPAFALSYSIVGVALSHLLVHARSDSRLTQVELMRENWSRVLLFTDVEQINLQEHQAKLDLNANSRPFLGSNLNILVSSNPSAQFYHDASGARFSFRCESAAEVAAHVRSTISDSPPCTLNGDGKIEPADDFSGAWLWDGSQWHDLGALLGHRPVDWKAARIIHPHNSNPAAEIISFGEDSSFPRVLEPLLNEPALENIGRAGDAVFLGAKSVRAVPLHEGKGDRLETRRVVAYQFHLAGGSR